MSQENWSGPGAHPVLASLDAMESALKDVADVSPMFMSAADKRTALVKSAQIQARLDELRLRVQAHSADVAAEDGARDLTAWTDHHNRVDRPTARTEQRLSEGLENRWRGVQAAMRDGLVSLTQAEAITKALDRLPDHIEVDVVAMAEARLVVEAAEHGPAELKIMGRRILDVIAPELGEAQERKALEAEEQAAQDKTYLVGRRRGDGRTKVIGEVPDPVWDRLITYLEPYLSPRRPGQAERNPDDRRPYDMQLGSAFASFLEHIDPKRLPLHGGDATTVMVSIDLATLQARTGAAGVATIDDVPLSAAAVRRLACTAKIIPVVLGGASEILDMGRASRLFIRSQRRAMRRTHKKCRNRGCRVKATWCEAHHLDRPWAKGGSTDLADGTLLCPYHHHTAHDPRYKTRVHPNGDITFHRRT